jgi:UDP-N-acetylglucosamine 3-dehydrogenase
VLRIGVIGAGTMGRNHARVLRDLDGVTLAGIADTNRAAARAAAQRFGVPHFGPAEELLDEARPDAVTVAVPTGMHLPVTLAALVRGVHVLVEKPIAPTPGEAREMIAAAERAGLVFGVGHVERYNPAILDLKRRLDRGDLGRIFKLHARRLGPFPERIRDVGVVIDLATHDLDVMRYLLGAEVVRVYAETERHVHTAHEDMLNGIIRFDSGAVGVLDVNWLTPTKVRELLVTGERGMFVANYLTQDLYFYENDYTHGNWSSFPMLTGVSEGSMTRVKLDRVEPLRAELAAFVDAVAGGAGPVVSGTDGLAALELAAVLVESGRTNAVVSPSGCFSHRPPPLPELGEGAGG